MWSDLRGAWRGLLAIAATYVAFLLCISNSPYTIKTGALLWFLSGVLSAVPAMVAVRRPARAPRSAVRRAPAMAPAAPAAAFGANVARTVR